MNEQRNIKPQAGTPIAHHDVERDVARDVANGQVDAPEISAANFVARDDSTLLRGLSGKLLILTMIFVMVAEILIFLPSIANYRNVWLQNHLDTAEVASIVYLDTSDSMLSDVAQNQLLTSTDSLAVVIRDGKMSRLMASHKQSPGEVSRHIDLSETGAFGSITSAISTLLFGGNEIMRVFGPMKALGGTIELVQEDRHLRDALFDYSRNVLLLSLAISLITASLVFLALYLLIVRPIKNISRNMTAFSNQPENAGLVFEPTNRDDEIGVAEKRLSSLQCDLQSTLRQKQHLADLGLAVSKINHDLRNILASAQLFSDRISQLPDPMVQRFAPKLIRTIDRAVAYTRSVIAYGNALERPPERRLHNLKAIVNDVAELLGLEQHADIEWNNQVPDDLEVNVDSEQLFRIIMNLCRNAVQAMNNAEDESAVSRLSIEAQKNSGILILHLSDTGPGIPQHIRENLFLPFQGSTKPGGTGLGLAIAAELARAHGGNIEIGTNNNMGAKFIVTIPDCGAQEQPIIAG